MRAKVGRAAWALLVCLGCGVAARAAEPDPAAPAQPASNVVYLVVPAP